MAGWTIGFIGAGKMGGAVARRLATGGHRVRVHDLNPEAVAACVTAGACAAESAEDAASGARVLFTSLPMPEHVLAAYESLLPVLKPETICVDVSTIDPATARTVSDRLAGHGVRFVACPLGKGPMQAEKGEIPVFVGGPRGAVEEIRPVLERMSNAVHDMGGVEAATMFKLISNLVGMANVAVLAEGYLLGLRAGIDPGVFTAALSDTGASSFQSGVRLPWIVDGDYNPRFAVDLAAKDVRLAVDAAARWGLATPVGSAGLAQLVSASAHGFGSEDVVAIAKILDPEGRLLGREDTRTADQAEDAGQAEDVPGP